MVFYFLFIYFKFNIKIATRESMDVSNKVQNFVTAAYTCTTDHLLLGNRVKLSRGAIRCRTIFITEIENNANLNNFTSINFFSYFVNNDF